MKRKLVYGATIKLAKENRNGIMKKVFAEARALSSEFDVYIWGFTDDTVVYYHDDKPVEVAKFSNNRERRTRYFQSIANYSININADVFYFRYASSDFFLLNALRKMKKAGIKNIIEVPTYPYEGEFKGSIKNRFILLLDRVLRPFLKRYVSAVVVFMGNFKTLFGIPTIQTMNGIDFGEIELVKPQSAKPVRMIEVSTMLPHHGCDRLINGIEDYVKKGGKENIHLAIVGDGPELTKYKNQVESLGLQQYVEFCGRKDGEELSKIFNDSNVAISSLGLHRIGLKSSSTLKAREYIARGLPIVYSTSDKLLDNNPYCLCCSDDDSPIDIEKVVGFLEYVYVDNETNKNIRQKGFEVCDMSVIMKPVVDYLKCHE